MKGYGVEEIAHPPYGPDLLPNDYCLFSKPKKIFEAEKYAAGDEVKNAVSRHFKDKSLGYFLKGIQILVQRCEKCIEVKGDYIEN